MKVLPKQLALRVQQMELAALKKNTCITGRQVLHMVYDWLRTDEHMSVMCGQADLMDVAWVGDKAHEMQKLLTIWDIVQNNMEEEVSEKVKNGTCCTGGCRSRWC